MSQQSIFANHPECPSPLVRREGAVCAAGTNSKHEQQALQSTLYSAIPALVAVL